MVVTWHFRRGSIPRFEPFIIFVMALGSALFAHITRRFSRRLERLRRATETISLRDLAVRVPVEGRGSVADLANSFNRMMERLDAQEKARRQFFADVAHELRHPLAILMGRLESIQDGVLPLDEEQVLLLHDMAIGLKRVVSDMSDLSLADVGQLKLHLSPVNISELVEQLQINLEPVAEDLGITLWSQVEKDMPPLNADADRLREVLVNLLTNALQHTPAGGKIQLTVERGDSNAILQVSDTGLGIDAVDLPHVFERFYRADKSRSRATGGTGLGLAIVKSLVELHGGTVEVQSTSGKGSKFTITVPLSK